MEALKAWLNDTFYMDAIEVVTYKGYNTERISTGNYNYTTFELPFDVTVTKQSQVLDVQACCAFVVVVLVFVTVVTWIRGAFK